MSKALFMFVSLNPLDNIPVDHIISVVEVGEKLLFNTVDGNGAKSCIEKPKTAFIMHQIEWYSIEFNPQP